MSASPLWRLGQPGRPLRGCKERFGLGLGERSFMQRAAIDHAEGSVSMAKDHAVLGGDIHQAGS